VTAASATAFTADEIFDLFYSLKAPYRKDAIFLMNDASVKALRKLKDSNGQYLWQPSLYGINPGYIAGPPGLYFRFHACHGGWHKVCPVWRPFLLLGG